MDIQRPKSGKREHMKALVLCLQEWDGNKRVDKHENTLAVICKEEVCVYTHTHNSSLQILKNNMIFEYAMSLLNYSPSK